MSLLCLLWLAQGSAYARSRHSIKAKVHFLAAGIMIRGTWGQNEDNYLAETISGKGNRELIRIRNRYPSWFPSISNSALASKEGIKFRLVRDETCDVAFGAMHLRAKPDDPTATLPIWLDYHPTIDNQPGTNDMLSCYRLKN